MENENQILISEDFVPNTFMEHLLEAYRKQVMGRTEYRLGNGTKVILNPSHSDLTTYYEVQKKRKKKY